jgi:hypothetical protein
MTVVRFLSGIVNRTNLISKQKMYPRGGKRRVQGQRYRVQGKTKQ